MEWQPATPEVLQRFESAVQGWPHLEQRRMFGYPCAFSNGHMFFYVYSEGMVLRLSPEDRAAFMQLEGAKPFAPKGGKGMKEYVVLPDWLAEDKSQLEGWFGKALAYVNALPAKQPKPRKSAKNSVQP